MKTDRFILVGMRQRATFRLGVGFTSLLFSTVKKLNKTRAHALHIVLEVLSL
jgi:hypothetical protein